MGKSGFDKLKEDICFRVNFCTTITQVEEALKGILGEWDLSEENIRNLNQEGNK